jgi:hypothetical protein
MSHRRKRKEKSEVNKNVREVTEIEEYNTFRMLIFQAAERIKEVIKAKGFEVGELKDCAPLFQFRCKKCQSEKIAAYIYTNTVALVCVECNTMEVVGSPNEIE